MIYMRVYYTLLKSGEMHYLLALLLQYLRFKQMLNRNEIVFRLFN